MTKRFREPLENFGVIGVQGQRLDLGLIISLKERLSTLTSGMFLCTNNSKKQ